jgi:hypothetical protein
MIGRLPVAILLFLGTASSVLPQPSQFKDNYELALRSQAFAEALVENDTRTMYRMFTPAFREQNSFARFDTAFARWGRGRSIVRARRKVVDIQALSGYVSNWVVFAGETDYNYLYGSWVKNGRVWELAWLSRILNQSFQYGQDDSADLRNAAEAALRYLLSPVGWKRLRGRLARPDTVVMVRNEDSGVWFAELDGRPVVWVTGVDSLAISRIPFAMRFAMGRVFGGLAEVVIDVLCARPELAPRRQGLKVYLDKKRGVWKFNSAARA